MHKTGSVVDPVSIKGFRYRLQEKRIVEVTEQNLEAMAIYFKERFAVDLMAIWNKEKQTILDVAIEKEKPKVVGTRPTNVAKPAIKVAKQ